MCYIKLLFIIISLICYGNCAKIMGIFPIPSKSHHILGSVLLKELANRGHEVTMVSPFPLEKPIKNYKDINLDGVLEMKEKHMEKFTNSNSTIYEKSFILYNIVQKGVAMVLENKNLLEVFNSRERFDVVIQVWALNEALLGISHRLNASTIGFSPVGGNPLIGQISGNPTPYSYVPNLFSMYSDKMSFIQRVLNTLIQLSMEILPRLLNVNIQKKLLNDFFPQAPPLEELVQNVDLVLVNSHIATETARPYLPNVIQIGGYHLQEKQILPDDLKNYLDNSKNGVIFFSLGSNLKSSDLSQDKLQAMLKSFKKSKYDVLWKFEKNLQNKPENVRLSPWLPQRAILQHPNVKAFITHGGISSTVEAIYNGVPMICIPFFGDQLKNTADSVSNGYAIYLKEEEINERTLTEAIREITENPSYRNNIKLKSDLYKNQEMNPMDKAVYWIEHVIKHKGAKHLKSYAIHIPWYQYMLLDVIAFISLVLFVSMCIIYFVFKKTAFSCLWRFRTKVKKN